MWKLKKYTQRKKYNIRLNLIINWNCGTDGCECRSYVEGFAGDTEDKCGTEEIVESV